MRKKRLKVKSTSIILLNQVNIDILRTNATSMLRKKIESAGKDFAVLIISSFDWHICEDLGAQTATKSHLVHMTSIHGVNWAVVAIIFTTTNHLPHLTPLAYARGVVFNGRHISYGHGFATKLGSSDFGTSRSLTITIHIICIMV